MKDNQELICWFKNYFYNCYYVKHNDYPDSIFMFYDINYIRKQKLAQLEGADYVEKTDVTGVYLFEQDLRNNYLWCYDLIWLYLMEHYSNNYDDIESFIKQILVNMIPVTSDYILDSNFIDYRKINILTPKLTDYILDSDFIDYRKIKIIINK